jgi:hypothetical protein
VVPDEPPLEVPDDPPPVVPPIEEPLPEVPLPDAPLPDAPLPEVPLPEVPLPEVPLPEVPLPEVPDEPLASDDFFLLLSLSLLDADEPPELPDEPVMPELLDAPARSDEPEPPVDELWAKAAPALPSAETRTAINSLFMY